MKIFGSISELVDLAFRLAGGKQVKIRSAAQNPAANATTIISIPDVAPGGTNTGDQNMVLEKVPQTLLAKTLSSPTISGGTINNSIIGGSTPAAGSFTAIVGATLDVNTSAELQTLTIPSLSTAGVLHNNSSGAVSSSLIVNADVDAAAAIAFSKLASLPSAEILVGSGAGVATARTVTGDVTIDNLGATTIGASKVTDGMLAGNITRTKLATGSNYRILANNSSGQMSENAALTPSEAVATDANGQLVSVTGVSATELGYLSGVTSDIQTQISAKANSGANSDITSLSGLTTALSGAQGGTGVANTGKTLTLGGNLVTSGNFTTTLTATNTTSLTLPTSGTLATTSNKLSDFAATTSAELAGIISNETGAGSLVFGNDATMQNLTMNGHLLGSTTGPIASGTMTPASAASLVRITSAANFSMIASPTAGRQYVIVNETATDITVANDSGATAANRIYTGTGADFTFKANSAVSVVYDGSISRWVLTGGGGAGGLATTYVTAGGITAVASTHYLTNLSAAGQTITLPAGVNGSVIRFSDAGEKWDVYPLTIAPATGEKIDNLATNESLVCDVKRGWVELSYNSSFGGWALMSLASTNASASGSGEVNAVLNPSAASGTTGWTGVTQVSSGSPLDPIVTTAFSISNAAGAESSTSGGYYSIASLAPGLKSKKLQVSFYYSTPATDVYRVSVYAGSTRLSLSSDSSGATSLPAGVTGGYFTATFDSTTASAYSLNITRTSGSTGACVITQVIVGPGIITQGAAISEWQSFTPTGSWTSNTTYTGRYRRVGETAEIRMRLLLSGAPTAATLTINLPSGLTINTSAFPQTVSQNSTIVGYGKGLDSGTADLGGFQLYYSSTTSVVAFYLSSTTGTASAVTNTAPVTFANGDVLDFTCTVPIAEWAGSGTVNLGAGAQVEYASVGGTWDADSTTTVYGPAGSTMGGALTATRDKTITWQYPPQADDLIVLEFKFTSTDGGWVPLADIWPNDNSNVGAYVLQTDSTGKTIIRFRRYRTGTTDWLNTYQWRVRKSKASAPVGFGVASPANGFGLVAPRLGQQALTVTGTNWTTVRAVGIYYQDQDGNHRLKFNLKGNTSVGATAITLTMAGVTFKNVGGFNQAFACLAAGSAPYTASGETNPNASTLGIYAGTSSTDWRASGDVELESKPTWA